MPYNKSIYVIFLPKQKMLFLNVFTIIICNLVVNCCLKKKTTRKF